ncbi:hypothetical protein PR370_18065 [Mycobacterium marinum]|uniref:hypothetical protein n=1 Tax=Mycobacterium marinum TaxID=1781 RepID=UPI00233FC6B7|nr:hypothetical protein [Mycobacterium marinum]MDC8984259.1 hypothetical protein [Mycobacterium marinum]MDC8995444.1 hypothetical protein [Mycobacterium marinum]MDC9001363.1 hypothetical protein [Mycobacterium marinum]MDC9011946.1 hypothetical protein [Mycobacterium marinum]WDZ12448.1 hypothetical protein PQR73_017335 [Mycobacterium marinum]
MESGSVHLLVFGGGQRLVGLGRLVLQVGQVAQVSCGSLVRRFQQVTAHCGEQLGRIGCCVGVDDVRRVASFDEPGTDVRSPRHTGMTTTGSGQPHMAAVATWRIGIYPDEGTARDTLDRLVPARTPEGWISGGIALVERVRAAQVCR